MLILDNGLIMSIFAVKMARAVINIDAKIKKPMQVFRNCNLIGLKYVSYII